MSITLNLVSEKKNIINEFLNSYFEKDMLTDENTLEWSYTTKEPLSSIEFISAVIDNYDENLLACWISMDANVFLRIRNDNINEIIKYIINRFSKTS